MPEVGIQIRGMAEMREMLAKMQEDVPREIAIAASKTGKKAINQIGKVASKIVAMPAKRLKKVAYYKANSRGVLVRIRGVFNVALKHFKPNQNKTGTTARVSRGGGVAHNRSNRPMPNAVPGAFMGSRPGRTTVKLRGQVMQRKGKQRLPIEAVQAMNLANSLRKNNAVNAIIDGVKDEFVKQVKERIRFLMVKKQRRLTWQKPKPNPA